MLSSGRQRWYAPGCGASPASDAGEAVEYREAVPETAEDVLTAFWARTRAAHPGLPVGMPEAWAFGATPETTAVEILPFDGVSAEHARAEGEGDRSLATWRAIHERYWRRHAQNPRGFEPTMPVVCERFRLVHAEPADRASGPG